MTNARTPTQPSLVDILDWLQVLANMYRDEYIMKKELVSQINYESMQHAEKILLRFQAETHIDKPRGTLS